MRVERGSAAVALLDPDGKEIALPNMLSNLNSLAAFLVAAMLMMWWVERR